MPVATTAVGGTLLALLEAELCAGRASDLLRSCAAPRRPRRRGRQVRARDPPRPAAERRRGAGAWAARHGSSPRPAGGGGRRRGPRRSRRAGALAPTIASRPLRGERGAAEPRRATASSCARRRRSRARSATSPSCHGLAPRSRGPGRGARASCASTPGAARPRAACASAAPTGCAASRRACLLRLAPGRRVPRRASRRTRCSATSARRSSGLRRAATPSEERFLFHACVSRPTKRLYLSWRASGEDGVADARSPFVDEVLGLLAPAPPAEAASDRRGELEDRRRTSTEVRRSRAHAARPRAGALRARRAARAPTAPGPDRNPARAGGAPRPRRGGTTLEGFDACSYRWFVDHELDPQRLEPAPDPLWPGRPDARACWSASTASRPAATPSPAPATSALEGTRSASCSPRVAAKRGLGADPAERRSPAGSRAGALPRRRGGPRDPGFEPGCSSGGSARTEAAERPRWRSTAARCTGDRSGRPRRADGRAIVVDYKSRERTGRGASSSSREAPAALYMIAAPALRDRRGRRPLPAARRLGDSAAARCSCARTPPTSSRPGCKTRTSSTPRSSRSGWTTPAARPPTSPRDEGRRHPPRPRPAARSARPRSAPPSATSRRSAAATGRLPRPEDEWERALSGRTPTPAQRRGDRGRGPRRACEAGAGTGKTGVLVDRYCRLLASDGVSPDAVLAFTFTERAASRAAAADPRGAGAASGAGSRAGARAAAGARRAPG